MRVVLGSEIKRADDYTITQTGIPSLVLMERAAYSFVEVFLKQLTAKSRIMIVCGTGNNGADGLAAARMLAQKGFAVQIAVLGDEKRATKQWKQQKMIIENLGIYCIAIGGIGEKSKVEWKKFDWVVDALFGVGLSREIQGVYKEVIEAINLVQVPVAAMDIPSGVNGDTGHIMGIALKARFTVTFGAYKTGLMLYPGKELAGEVYVADIGLDERGFEQVTPMEIYTEKEIRLPRRIPYANKGTYGRIYIIGGQKNMAGAVCFSALGAYSCGAGLVKIQTPEENRTILQTLVPQAILSTNSSEIEENIRWADVIVMGPGLGMGDNWHEVIGKVIASGKPAILDADALNLMAEHQKETGRLAVWDGTKHKFPPHIIVTPHLGEMSRLLQCSISSIQQSLMETCRDFCQNHGGICVLKDAVTLVQDDESLYLNTTGNDGMSVGGSGDVLTGMIAALVFAVQQEEEQQKECGQGRNCQQEEKCGQEERNEKKKIGDGVKLAVYLHGLAGDKAAEEKGKRSMNVMDIIEHIPEAIKHIEGRTKA